MDDKRTILQRCLEVPVLPGAFDDLRGILGRICRRRDVEPDGVGVLGQAVRVGETRVGTHCGNARNGDFRAGTIPQEHLEVAWDDCAIALVEDLEVVEGRDETALSGAGVGGGADPGGGWVGASKKEWIIRSV